jgi:hypothetical protein
MQASAWARMKFWHSGSSAVAAFQAASASIRV